MNIFTDIKELTVNQGNVALACGNFDGVHLGHQEVFRQLIEFCEKSGFEPAIFCFSPHPRKVLSGDKTVKLLTSDAHKLRLFSRYGIKNVVVCEFSSAVAMMEPEAFVRSSLINSQVKAVFTGKDWRFGRSGLGDVNTLNQMSSKLNFAVCPVSEVDFGPEKVSSSNIRDHILAGELSQAEKLLGRRFSLLGKVVAGEKIAGGKLKVPTANVACENEIVPPSGVYSGFVKIEGEIHPGIINVGYSPTFHDTESPIKVEFHVFDYDSNLYQKEIEVEFVSFIRGEKKFSSIESLKREISANVVTARSILAGCNPTIKE